MRAVAVLLHRSGSGVRDRAVVRTATLPGAPARTVTVNRALAPLARAGRVQLAMPPCTVQPGVHDTPVSVPGSAMVAVTWPAVAGPAVAAVRVQLLVRPVMMVARQDS